MGKRKILGITPARGGSKGIPYKNIKIIANKPLIAWTIEKALESKFLDKFVVSTEDKKIKEISKTFGAEVIDRPMELAEDSSPTLDVLIQVLKVLEPDFKPDIVVLLQPTSPIRRKGLIDDCISKFIETSADHLVTGFKCKHQPYSPNIKDKRQDVDGFFSTDGNVYVVKAELIKKGDFFGQKIEYFYTKREENVDIDDIFDFWIAEKILEQRSMEISYVK